MDKNMFLDLYKGLVRPLSEYCMQAWSPYKRKHIDLIEGVQRRATRLVPEFRRIFYDRKLKLWRRMTYEERLAELQLTKLEDRRIRGDMIVVKSPGTSLEISRGTTALGLTNIMAKPNTLSWLGFDKKLEKFWWGCNKVTHHACDKRITSAHFASARAYMVLWQRRKDNAIYLTG